MLLVLAIWLSWLVLTSVASFSLSHQFIGADSLIPAGLVNVKWSPPLPTEPTEEPRVEHNASIPTLADKLLAAMQVATVRNEPPEPMTESDNAKDATKPLNLHRPDKELGDLDWRFSEDIGRFVMDKEVGRNLNLPLRIRKMEPSMCCMEAPQSCTWLID